MENSVSRHLPSTSEKCLQQLYTHDLRTTRSAWHQLQPEHLGNDIQLVLMPKNNIGTTFKTCVGGETLSLSNLATLL